MEEYPNCVMCRRGFYRGRYQAHILGENLPEARPAFSAYLQEHAMLEVVFNSTRRVCHRCWQRANNAVRQREVDNPQAPQQQQPQHVGEERQMPIQVIYSDQYMRTSNTSRRCIFNTCRSGSRLLTVPEPIKIRMLCDYNLYIPKLARVCEQHLDDYVWDELLANCNVFRDFNAAQFNDLCNILTSSIRRGTRLNFEVRDALSNSEMHYWTGLNGNQFDSILNQIPSLRRKCKNPRTALGIYLTKLRTGEPNERLATLYNMSRRNLERMMGFARDSLENEYVPMHLGFNHISRDEVLRRNLYIPKGIFGNRENTKAIIICDGTYVYIQKSSNFLFQRESYSMHKFRNLLKPFLIVCTDGYIIDVVGPYSARKSDATIMQSIVNNPAHPLIWFLEQNDVLILDRGFRDSLPHIEACGFEPHIPPTKHRNETPLTTEQANESRLVTITRWVIEVVNGRFKRDFKLLRQEYFNRALPHAMVDFKIAAAILNHLHEPLSDNIRSNTILEMINMKKLMPNHLHTFVEQNNLNRRRVGFERIDANLPQLQDFPHLSEEDVTLIALGSYHLKLAKSYCSEHLQNGIYMIEVYRENTLNFSSISTNSENVWLLRGRIQSRHVRVKTYYSYILMDRNQNGTDAIKYHYCSCLTGRRTVGSCAHIISILWYLGRHHDLDTPAGFLNNVIIDID